jgi:hypothetical protein
MQKEYSYGRVRTINSQIADHSDRRARGWFSEALSWLADRPFLILCLFLLALLLMSVACDRILDGASSGVSETRSAVPQGESPAPNDSNASPASFFPDK